MTALQKRARREGACLIFIGGSERGGYARVRRANKWVAVHRVAYEEAYGPIPPGLLVCHRCDRRRCIEPTHLFVGTHADNNADRDRKGRQPPLRGEANGRAKLSWSQVAAIRSERRQRGTTYRVLAQRYGVSERMIGYVVRGANWQPDFRYEDGSV
jgi:hypothetical protein